LTDETPRTSPSFRATAAAGLLVVVTVLALLAVVAIVEATHLRALARSDPRPPLWDMAKNGRLALEVALDLQDLDPLALLKHLNQHDTWPPAYALWLAPFFLVAGSGFEAAAMANAALFVLLPLALLWAAREIEPENGLGAGILAASLALTAPLYRLHSVLVMRELASAVTLVLAVALHARARRKGDSQPAWTMAALAATALFFIKYNYGLLWIATALLDGILFHRVDRPHLRRLAWPRDGAWGRKTLLVAVALLIAAQAFGASVGGAAYAVLLLSLVGFAWTRLRKPTLRESTRLTFNNLPAEARAALRFFFLPVLFWCLIPQPMHLRALLDFLENRSTGLGFLANLTFYPRAMVGDYAADPWIGIGVLLLAFLGLRALVRGDRSRTAAIAIALFALASVLHPYKIERFFAPTAALLFLLAGLTAAAWTKRPWVALCAGLLVSGVVWGTSLSNRPALDEKFLAGYRAHSGPPEILSTIDRLAADQPPPAGRFALLGGFNELSPDLVAWRLLRRGQRGGQRIELVSSLPRPADSDDEAKVTAALRRWIAKRKPQTLWVVALDPQSPLALAADYRDHAAWQSLAAAALRQEPGWRETGVVEEPELGLRIGALEATAR